MSTWKEVGEWLKSNAMDGANLVGSLLTGNIPNAIASGVSLISGATGYAEPEKALESLQAPNSPALIRLRELSLQNEASIRSHILEMERIRLQDKQFEQKETQETIREGDRAQDVFVRATRPGLAWSGFFAAFAYIIVMDNPNEFFFQLLIGFPYAYMGARAYDKYLKSKQ